MDSRPLFQTLYTLAEDNITFFRDSTSEAGLRFLAAFKAIREHSRSLEPVLNHFATIYHIFDLDEHTPANGYRSLAQTVRCCLAHIVHKSRYVASNRRSIFFRTHHNCAELETYCAALTQLRALVYLAQHLLTQNQPGSLFNLEDRGLSNQFLHEYITMHKGCFYGRCMGFQFAPSIRPFLQTIAISLVSFGENYKHHVSGLGVAAGSLFTSGKFAIDPELRGNEFERITQNLDVHFWKSFWNLTEMELLASLASMTSSTVRLCRVLSVPPHSFELPLAADPKLTVTITPPVAHTGPGSVDMRLISHELREGQDSEELCNLMRPEGPLSVELRWRTKPLPRSPYLIVHFHGGGFVAQTSKSHEPYLKNWAQELGAPILSIDYSLAPEAPFPRALEECFYAYCWAIKNCHLLGSTAQTVCLAGDSAGGNLCVTVSMRAAAFGIKMPDGIMAAYPAMLLQASASPSRLLTLLDPLLPLSVLYKCLSAYAGMEPEESDDPTLEKLAPMNMMRRDTAMFFRDLRLGASALFSSLMENACKSNEAGRPPGRVSFAGCLQDYFWCPVAQLLSMLSLAQLFRSQGPSLSNPAAEAMKKSISEVGMKSRTGFKESRKSQTCQDLSCTSSASPGPDHDPSREHQDGFSLNEDKHTTTSSSTDHTTTASSTDHTTTASSTNPSMTFPDGFQPLRSDQPATSILLELSPIVKNPFMSPLLAPDTMLKGLPPVHIVACALDPMLDDSVMFARRLRAAGQPVTLRVIQDLPHGFLSLSQVCRETRQATAICTELLRDILVPPENSPPQAPPVSSLRKHRKLERLSQGGTVPNTPSHPPLQKTSANHHPEEVNGTSGESAPSPKVTSTQEPQKSHSSPEAQQRRSKDGSTSSPTPDPRNTPGPASNPSGSTAGRGVGA